MLVQLLSHHFFTRLITVVFCALFVITQPAGALVEIKPPTLKDAYLQNRTTHYDRNATDLARCPPGEATASSSSGGSTVAGNNNAEKIWNFFIGKGLTPQQVAGIIGNWQIESGLRPDRVQGAGMITSDTIPTSGGYGLAQWDDRKFALRDYAAAQKRPVSDLGLQLDFAWHELTGSESAALADLKAQTTVTGATESFMRKYERPGILHLDARIAAAQDAYGALSGAATSSAPAPNAATPPVSTQPSDVSTPDASKKCIADFYNGGNTNGSGSSTGGGGGSGSTSQAANRIVQIALAEEGTPESQSLKYTDGVWEAWCADFVSWVYKEAGASFTGGASGGWRIASVPNLRSYLQSHGYFYTRDANAPDAKPGDVYVVSGNTHVGIVIGVENGNLQVISGNSSNMVKRTTYTNYKNNPQLAGWGGL